VTASDTAVIEQAAAHAALAVPGVTELQPSLCQSLAAAATRARQALGSPAPSPEAGIHAEHSSRTGAWRIEIRCVVNSNRRVLDTAHDVHDNVLAAVRPHAARHDEPESVAVVVSVTRITGS
jgi:uncharacterized alkaline shock family protein YloU